jgi:hypothetical protein
VPGTFIGHVEMAKPFRYGKSTKHQKFKKKKENAPVRFNEKSVSELIPFEIAFSFLSFSSLI